MRRRPVVARRALVVATLLSMLLVGCSRSESNTDSLRVPATPLAAAAGALPGALTKPIDQYSGDELYSFTHALRFGGGVERPRKCKGDPACQGAGARKTKVRVDAVDDQDSLGVTAVPVNGVVAIRAINTGKDEEARYGFKADKKLEYYLIVLPGTGGAGRWRLEQLDTTAGARRHSPVAAGAFEGCNHPWPPTPPAIRADFRTCADATPPADSVRRLELRLQALDDLPMWITCLQGCCVVER